MKVSLLVSFVVMTVGWALELNSDPDNIFNRIDSAHAHFSDWGPTIDVLGEYEALVHELETTSFISNDEEHPLFKALSREAIAQIYFKKALTEINLNKVKMAVDDLLRVIKIDPSIKTAHTQLVELLIEQGDFTTLKKLVVPDDQANKQISERILSWERFQNRSVALLSQDDLSIGDIDECLAILSGLVKVSSSNAALFDSQLKCSKLKIIKQDFNSPTRNGTETIDYHFKTMVKSLDKLIKLLVPATTVPLYLEVAQNLMFTHCSFKSSRNFIKSCLRIDNDDAKCGRISKHYAKSSKFYDVFEAYAVFLKKLYPDFETLNEISESDEVDIEWQFINDFLFNDELKLSGPDLRKLTAETKSVKTNYDYLMHLATKFVTEEFADYDNGKYKKLVGSKNLVGDLKFVNTLNSLACESYIQLENYKEGNKFCKKHIPKEPVDKLFLPKYIYEIDLLLKKQKYSEAVKKLNLFNDNVKKTRMFKKRQNIVEEYKRKLQQQKQKQQQQQQQQQQYQQYQQQQQRQQASRKPANDYYKVLDISRDADEKTIKKGYRTQTLKYHPDKYKGSDLTPEQIENKMQEINQAYEVLSVPELRQRYDNGDDPNDNSPDQGNGGPGGMHFNFNGDFFKQFMGGQQFQFQGFGGGGGHRHNVKFENRRG